MHLKQNQRMNKNLVLLILAFILNIKCKVETASQKITYFYNDVVNDKMDNSYSNNDIVYHMKYLLDTIIKKHYRSNDKDTKYCIFYFPMFGNSTFANYIDTHDTVSYWIKETDETINEIKKSHFKLNDSIINIGYTITENYFSKSEIKLNRYYNLYFNRQLKIEPEPMSFDGIETPVILKFWNNKSNGLSIEFYKFYKDSLVQKPNEFVRRKNYNKASIHLKEFLFFD